MDYEAEIIPIQRAEALHEFAQALCVMVCRVKSDIHYALFGGSFIAFSLRGQSCSTRGREYYVDSKSMVKSKIANGSDYSGNAGGHTLATPGFFN